MIKFLGIWWLIGAASILFRNKMICDERPRQYRIALTLLTAPVGLSLNVLTGAAFGAWRYFTHAADQVRGKQTDGAA